MSVIAKTPVPSVVKAVSPANPAVGLLTSNSVVSNAQSGKYLVSFHSPIICPYGLFIGVADSAKSLTSNNSMSLCSLFLWHLRPSFSSYSLFVDCALPPAHTTPALSASNSNLAPNSKPALSPATTSKEPAVVTIKVEPTDKVPFVPASNVNIAPPLLIIKVFVIFCPCPFLILSPLSLPLSLSILGFCLPFTHPLVIPFLTLFLSQKVDPVVSLPPSRVISVSNLDPNSLDFVTASAMLDLSPNKVIPSPCDPFVPPRKRPSPSDDESGVSFPFSFSTFLLLFLLSPPILLPSSFLLPSVPSSFSLTFKPSVAATLECNENVDDDSDFDDMPDLDVYSSGNESLNLASDMDDYSPFDVRCFTQSSNTAPAPCPPPLKKSRYFSNELVSKMENVSPIVSKPVILNSSTLPALPGNLAVAIRPAITITLDQFLCFTLFHAPDVSPDFVLEYLVRNNLPIFDHLKILKSIIRLFVASEAEYREYCKHTWGFGEIYCPPGYNPRYNAEAFYRLMYSSYSLKDPSLCARVVAFFATLGITTTSVANAKGDKLLVVYFGSLRDFLSAVDIRSNKGCLIIPSKGTLSLFACFLPTHIFFLSGNACPTILKPVLSFATVNDRGVSKLDILGLPSVVRDQDILEELSNFAVANDFRPSGIIFLTTYHTKGKYKGSSGFALVHDERLAMLLASSVIRSPKYTLSFALVVSEYPSFLLFLTILFDWHKGNSVEHSFPLQRVSILPSSLLYHLLLCTVTSLFLNKLFASYPISLLLINLGTFSGFLCFCVVCFPCAFIISLYLNLFALLLVSVVIIMALCPFLLSFLTNNIHNSNSSPPPVESVYTADYNSAQCPIDIPVVIPSENRKRYIIDERDGDSSDSSDDDHSDDGYSSESDSSSSDDTSSDSEVDSPADDCYSSVSSSDTESYDSDDTEILSDNDLASLSDSCTEDETNEVDSFKNSDNTLIIASVNARGTFYTQLHLFIEKIKFVNADIVLIQDTGAIKSTFLLKKEGFSIHHTTAVANDKAGTLAIVIRSTLNSFFSLSDPAKNTLPFQLSSRIMHGVLSYPICLNIVNAYAKTSLAEPFEQIGNLPSLVIAGDLNSFVCSSLDAFSSKTKPNCKPRPLTKLFDNGMVDTYRFLHPNKKAYTRFGTLTDNKTGVKHATASRIDYFLTSKDILDHVAGSFIHDNKIIDCTDHLMISIAVHSKRVPIALLQDSFVTRQGIKNSTKWKTTFKDNTFKCISGSLPHWKDTTVESILDADFLAGEVTSAISRALNESFPNKINVPTKWTAVPKPSSRIFKSLNNSRKKISGAIRFMHKCMRRKHPSIDDGVKKLILDINKRYCKADKFRIDPEGDFFYILSKLEKTRRYIAKRLHRLFVINKATNISKIVKKILSKVESRPEKIFSLIGVHKRSKVEFVSRINNKQVELLFDKDMILEIQTNWANIFSSKTAPSDLSNFLKHMPSIPLGNVIQPDFSFKNLSDIVKNKRSTAPGPSDNTWKSIKNSHPAILSVLSKIFTFIYENGYIPEDWKEGKTILLEKPTKDIGLDKFRPITLLSVEYKLYSHVLNEALVKNLAVYNIIPSAQNGFFPNRGSDQCLHTLINIITDSKFKNLPLYCLYIDFAKAFDSVEHWAIEAVLSHCNFGTLGKAIISTLKGSHTKIETIAGWTEAIEFMRGTKQGDILSPTIFILLLAPLLWALQKSDLGYFIASKFISVLALADDLVLLSNNIKNIEIIFELVKEYALLVGLTIKSNKSAAAYKGKIGFIPVVNGEPFENLGASGCYKYLGVYINLDLNWNEQCKISEHFLKNSVELILSKFYVPCSLHIKLINAVSIAALAYRMQFILFENSWLDSLNKWIISKLSLTHSYFNNSSPHYWSGFLNLLDLNALNKAIYISNLVKNLNKPNLIAFSPLNFATGTFLHFSHCSDHLPHPFIPKVAPFLSKHNLNLINCAALNKFKEISMNNPDITNSLNTAFHFNASKDILLDPVSSPAVPANLVFPPLAVCRVYTDGACNLYDKIMKGAIFIPDIPFSLSFPVHGSLCSTEAELHSIEFAIKFGSIYKNIQIFTDSLSAINLIINFPSLNTNAVLKTNCRAVLRRIHSLLTKSKLSVSNVWPPSPGTNITLYHFHSHMKENANKYLRHSKFHKDRLGNLFQSVLDNNSTVDLLANIEKNDVNTNSPKLLLPGNDHWQLYNTTDSMPIYSNIKKFIYNSDIVHNLSIVKKSKPAFSSRLFHPSVSRNLSTGILRDVNPHSRGLSNFIHKSLDKSLPTKKRVNNNINCNSYRPPSNPSKRRKLEHNYASSFCSLCTKLGNVEVVEDTAHVFSHCPFNQEIYTSVTVSILKIINDFVAPTFIASFPFWFTAALPLYTPINDAEEELASFPKELGDMGYIPHALKNWFIVNKFNKKGWKKIVRKISLTFQKAVYEKWINRCDVMFDNPFRNRGLPNT